MTTARAADRLLPEEPIRPSGHGPSGPLPPSRISLCKAAEKSFVPAMVPPAATEKNSANQSWSPRQSADLYAIDAWGHGFFGVDSRGHATVRLRDGGQWLAENPNYTAGDGSPVSFGYQFEWGPNRAYVEIEIFGRAEYDTHQSYWKILSAWHPESRRAEHFQVGAGGDVGTGIAYYPSETHEEILIEFVNPDGSRMYLKDVSETIDEDHFVSTSYLRSSPDEEWRESQVLNWERVRG